MRCLRLARIRNCAASSALLSDDSDKRQFRHGIQLIKHCYLGWRSGWSRFGTSPAFNIRIHFCAYRCCSQHHFARAFVARRLLARWHQQQRRDGQPRKRLCHVNSRNCDGSR
ncbi:hypothetical protein PHSY_000352 [Pseudozyma hubeiensis SY62]|uniref:Uncharacterized protein n=1 Tax=Pseudozyma hubeiensis (strain SY62) TaxID=1305764 RepID=R9NWD2_PSEHS|nr:hypothetical protein PHSY_000352 [Pseudozyma hubeiensis SY62]GAC92796.1 hypothetical protein PHSY_000352 [Pseudozyma hubeiensis SY62]